MAITHSTYGRLGNHIWAYCVARSIAQKKGFDFFSESDLVEIVGLEKFTPSEINNHFPCENSWDLDDNYHKNIYDIEDNTKIWGFFQHEKYILWNREEIISWFNVHDYKYFGDDTCIIHFRGGDYKWNECYLPKEYYYNSIKKMDELYPGINFVVITDDIDEAKIIFPNFPCYSFGILEDFSIIKHARYLIIANSTFSWWGAWINKNSILTIAPKYFVKYNQEIGDAIKSRLFSFICKDGDIHNSTIETLIINLETRKDRRKSMIEKMGNNRYSFFNAIDGRRISENKYIKHLFRNNDHNYNKAVIGCALSHYTLWNKLLNSKNDYFLILEDDITIDGDIFPMDVENFIFENKDFVDVLFLGYHVNKDDEHFFDTDEINVIKDLPCWFIGGTFAYIITKTGIRNILKKISENGINKGIDTFMHENLNNIFYANKRLAKSDWYYNHAEGGLDSDIQHSHDSFRFCNKYSVIIPTIQKAWNITRVLLDSILKDDFVGEVILINNGGRPIKLVNEKLKIINLQENIFVNAAWNLGVETSKFDNIALINDDILLPNNLFSRILDLDNYGIIGCNQDMSEEMDLTPFDSEVYEITPMDFRPHQFGVVMFFKKERYRIIPSKFKIWYGDDYIFNNNINNGIVNVKIKIEPSASSSLSMFKGIKDLDMELSYNREIKIDFIDWWQTEYGGELFNKENNFFINMLRNMYPFYSFQVSENPDIAIFNYFSKNVDKYSCRKIFYSGEVSELRECDHNFTFNETSEKNTRLPLWLVYLKNEEFRYRYPSKRDEFCSMINSSQNDFKIEFLEKLSLYKKVHSTGGALNNMGYITERGENVSGKINHQSKYKFVTAFENQISEGYVTEKILDAFRAGAVPLYYGTPDVTKDFNPKCFINYNDFNSVEEFCDFIARVDQDDELYNSYFEEDIFAPEWRDIVYDKDHPFYTDIAKKIIGDKF